MFILIRRLLKFGTLIHIYKIKNICMRVRPSFYTQFQWHFFLLISSSATALFLKYVCVCVFAFVFYYHIYEEVKKKKKKLVFIVFKSDNAKNKRDKKENLN